MTKYFGDELKVLENLVYPRVALSGAAYSTYTATLGNKTLSGTTNAQGEAEIFLSELGTWTIEVSNSNGIKSSTVTATNLGVSYDLAITYTTLTVTADVGNTITATNGNYEVSGTVGSGGIINLTLGTGTWTLTSSNGVVSVSDTVSISNTSTSLSKTLKLSTITVTTDANNSVSATDGTHTVSGIANSSGSCVLQVGTGSWTVTTSNGSVSATSAATSVSAHSTNYNVTIKLPYITVTGDNGNTITATKGETVVSGIVSGGSVVLKVETGTWTLKSTSSSNSNIYVTDSVTVSSNGTGYSKTLKLPTITVTTAASASVSATKSGVTVNGTANSSGICVLKVAIGTWNVTATSGSNTKSSSVTLSTHSTNINLALTFVSIYGAQWDGSSSTIWTRTDAAASFSDPVPYKSGMTASQCGSPFDNKMPWSGMTVSSRTGGSMVAIPKFWYKLTQNGNSIKVQIADAATTGFNVSPAHMDRGDGTGERDVIYVGRYHCASDYKSKTGVVPVANITRSTARTNIHNLGTKIWQMDFAMRFTIWLLYIVEFADWNSQAKIGYGCGNNSSTENMGYTDSMPYHTGTTKASQTTYGLGTQYRNIEGLWDNVFDWCDGCYYNSNGMNIILNPVNFRDSANGTSVGTPTSGYPSKISVTNVSGTFPMFIPSKSNGSNSTYTSDYWNFYAGYPCLFVGGYYGQSLYYGLFYIDGYGTSDKGTNIGARLQELP